MKEESIKYLELLQGVITRMANTLSQTHRWCLTLLAALWTLICKGSMPFAASITITSVIIIMFWGLAGFYLRYQKIFRKKYDTVVAVDFGIHKDKDGYIPFELTPSERERDSVSCVARLMFSKTLLWIYGILMIVNVSLVLMVC